MKSKDYVLIGLLIALFLAAWLWQKQNQSKDHIIDQLSLQVDSLQIQTNKKIIEFKERKIIDTKIVDRWNNVYTTDSFISLDTLFFQAKTDINYLDTSLKKCDTALNSCLILSRAQDKLLNMYRSKKEPVLVPYIGVGISLNLNKSIEPSIQAGIGVNLNKLIGK